MEERTLRLQPRLQMLADMIPQGARLADVGTDHGYLPVWLLQEGRIRRAIASDINAEPLAHARRTAEAYGTAEAMDFRLCAGLDGIVPGEADVVVIAGMGGETICAILEAAPWLRDGAELLLQPMTKTEELRAWLSASGYRLLEERLVEDKDFLYPILRTVGGTMPPMNEEELWAGRLLESDPLWGRYLTQQQGRIQKRLDGLRRARREADAGELLRLEKLYMALEGRKERWNREHGTRD